MADLHTDYLGFRLTCPLVAAASPVTARLDSIRALEDAGIGAVVLPSLFEEQIEHEEVAVQHLMATGADASGEAPEGFAPIKAAIDNFNGHSAAPAYDFGGTVESYLEHIRKAKESVDVPIIASMNGTTTGTWLRYATLLEDAGADAIELNIYYIAADPSVTGQDVEARFVSTVRALRQKVDLPLVVKLPPFFSSPANAVLEIAGAGAQSVVLFNRLVHPDIDLGALQVEPRLTLSSSDEVQLALRWIAILFGKVDCELAATTGAHTAEDALKLLLAGSTVVTMASALLRNGPAYVSTVREEIAAWLDEREYASINQLRGSLSHVNSPNPVAFERANYMKGLLSYQR